MFFCECTPIPGCPPPCMGGGVTPMCKSLFKPGQAWHLHFGVGYPKLPMGGWPCLVLCQKRVVEDVVGGGTNKCV